MTKSEKNKWMSGTTSRPNRWASLVTSRTSSLETHSSENWSISRFIMNRIKMMALITKKRSKMWKIKSKSKRRWLTIWRKSWKRYRMKGLKRKLLLRILLETGSSRLVEFNRITNKMIVLYNSMIFKLISIIIILIYNKIVLVYSRVLINSNNRTVEMMI